jgi:hypothetical protein
MQCFGRPLANRAVTTVSGRIKIRKNLPAVADWAKSLSKSHCDGRDMPMVAPTIAQIATVGKVMAKSAESGQPVFTSMDVVLKGLLI